MLLALHAGAGAAALVLGPLALGGRQRAVVAYRALVLLVALTALPLASSSTLPTPVRLALAVVALGSAATAVLGGERGLRASFVALVSALVFVSAPVWAGALVVLVGSTAAHLVPLRRPDLLDQPARGPQCQLQPDVRREVHALLLGAAGQSMLRPAPPGTSRTPGQRARGVPHRRTDDFSRVDGSTPPSHRTRRAPDEGAHP